MTTAMGTDRRAIKVILVEDDQLAQLAIQTYLSKASDMELVGVAADAVDAIALATALKPDVAIVDIHLPGMSGIELTRYLTKPPAQTRVVCFTALGDDRMMLQALDAGASGFLLKSDSPGLIIHGVRSAHSGDALVSPKLVASVLEGTRPKTAPPRDLTTTDRELLRLIGKGRSNAEIGKEMYLATSTVKTYVSRLLGRLGRPNRASLATLAHEWGLVRSSDD